MAAKRIDSRTRLLRAAAIEFGRKSYAAVNVESIAARAHLNKAMLYYHFGSKLGLYQALLRDAFGQATAEFDALAAAPLAPDEKLRRAVEIFVTLAETRPFFPPTMLREVASRGEHLDAETARALSAVPRAIGVLVQQGVDAGVFHPINPILVHLTIVGPLMMFVASAPLRRRLAAIGGFPEALVSRETLVTHLQNTVLSLVRIESAPSRRGADAPR
jgi:TetR/AcrR family transcriptional regulator